MLEWGASEPVMDYGSANEAIHSLQVTIKTNLLAELEPLFAYCWARKPPKDVLCEYNTNKTTY